MCGDNALTLFNVSRGVHTSASWAVGVSNVRLNMMGMNASKFGGGVKSHTVESEAEAARKYMSRFQTGIARIASRRGDTVAEQSCMLSSC